MTVFFIHPYNFTIMGIRNNSTISVHTLGCKLNQAESEILSRELANRGYVVTGGNKAETFIINTCSVTHSADSKARHLVRMLRMLNPQARIAVTGCYAEKSREELVRCGADFAIANRDKQSIPGLLHAGMPANPEPPCDSGQGNSADRIRTFIKVQDGCRNFCAYCIVPLVRDRVYSIGSGALITEIKARVSEGFREAVLTGTEVGSYRSGDIGLMHLLKLILQETGIERLRLSSLQPQHISRELIDLWQNDRMCRHFHIALQSGSDAVLSRMKRGYDTIQFKHAVEMIRNHLPDASITTDIMVGFPGESDEEFTASYDFCRLMKFAAIHVFTFSARPGTAASKMSGKITEKVKKERSRAMLELAAISADGFAGSFTGNNAQVLWEREVRKGSGIYSGLTGNYIRAYTRSREGLSNTITTVRLLFAAPQAAGQPLRASTRGNHGELWGEST